MCKVCNNRWLQSLLVIIQHCCSNSSISKTCLWEFSLLLFLLSFSLLICFFVFPLGKQPLTFSLLPLRSQDSLDTFESSSMLYLLLRKVIGCREKKRVGDQFNLQSPVLGWHNCCLTEDYQTSWADCINILESGSCCTRLVTRKK